MTNLITYKEFINSKSETSNYEPPKFIVEPAPNDKIFNYTKFEFDKKVLWGIDFDSQEQENKIKADR